MSLDKIKARLAALNKQQERNTGSKSSDLIWKPTAGEHVIRLVPNQYTEAGYPFVELSFYHNYGKKWMLSPHCMGRPDPVVEFCDTLTTGKRLELEQYKEAMKVKSKLLPTDTIFAPIIVRGETGDKVAYYGFTVKVFHQLLKFMGDPDYGDISDLTTGRDIKLEYITPKTEGAYPETKVYPKPNVSVATASKEILEKIKALPDIMTNFTEPSYTELQDAFEKYLNVQKTDSKPAVASNSTNVVVDHDATNEGFEIESTSDEVETPTDVADIMRQFDDVLEKRNG